MTLLFLVHPTCGLRRASGDRISLAQRVRHQASRRRQLLEKDGRNLRGRCLHGELEQGLYCPARSLIKSLMELAVCGSSVRQAGHPSRRVPSVIPRKLLQSQRELCQGTLKRSISLALLNMILGPLTTRPPYC